MNASSVDFILGDGVPYFPTLAAIAGGALPGVFLSRLYAFSRKASAMGQDGWFTLTQEQWERATGMTRREQETARKYLRDRGLIEECRKGLPARLFFRINEPNFIATVQREVV